MIVRDAIEKSLKPKSYKGSGLVRLWPSEIGGCPRRALYRILGYKPEKEFPLDLREKFQLGNVLEAETGRALHMMYGKRLKDQVRLRTKTWSGKCDWGLNIGERNPVLIEHKATGSKWWGKYGTPPRVSHIAQLVLYGQIYTEEYNIEPRLVLYYRAWSNWAELELDDLGDSVCIKGIMDGEDFYDEIVIDVTKRREYLEEYFALQEIPPYEKTDECYFRGKPSCHFFEQCHEGQKVKQNIAEWGLF